MMSALAMSFGLRTPLGMTGTTHGARFFKVERAPSRRLFSIKLSSTSGVFRVFHSSTFACSDSLSTRMFLLRRQVLPVMGSVPCLRSFIGLSTQLGMDGPRVLASQLWNRYGLMRQQEDPNRTALAFVRREQAATMRGERALKQRFEHSASVGLTEIESLVVLGGELLAHDVMTTRACHDDCGHVATSSYGCARLFAGNTTDIQQGAVSLMSIPSSRSEARLEASLDTIQRVRSTSVFHLNVESALSVLPVLNRDDLESCGMDVVDVESAAPQLQTYSSTSGYESLDTASHRRSLGWSHEDRSVAVANLMRFIRVSGHPRFARRFGSHLAFLVTGSPGSWLRKSRGVEIRPVTAVGGSLHHA